MARVRIAVDCDHVLADTNSGVRAYINETFGFQHTVEDYLVEGDYRGYWERIWCLPREKTANWLERYVASGGMVSLQLVEGALSTLERLKRQYSLVLVTARSKMEVECTNRWLQGFAPDLFDEVAFVHEWRDVSGLPKTKGQICYELGVECLIDDNYDHCLAAVGAGKRAILFGDYGWNRRQNVSAGMVRAVDWRAVEAHLS